VKLQKVILREYGFGVAPSNGLLMPPECRRSHRLKLPVLPIRKSTGDNHHVLPWRRFMVR
jgi:hypothetical protein